MKSSATETTSPSQRRHSEQRYPKILVCGKVGIGKSDLIYSMFGDDSPIKESIFETSGFLDGTPKSTDLQKVYNQCKDVDLVLFCIDMTISRLTVDERSAIELIATTFEDIPGFWKRCVLVLTKANHVWVPPSNRNDELGYHKARFATLIKTFRAELLKSVRKEIVEAIPAVAVGYQIPGRNRRQLYMILSKFRMVEASSHDVSWRYLKKRVHKSYQKKHSSSLKKL